MTAMQVPTMPMPHGPCERHRTGRTRSPAAGVAACIVAVALGASALAAQEIPKSQHASVSQTVAHTEITVVYDRPVAHGRPLFGALVPWGQVWTPGANVATTFEVNRAVRINGAVLPAGKYSVWSIPDRTQWTIIFNRQADAFHLAYPDGKDVLRVTATPHAGSHMETLAFYFPLADSTRAELDLHWGDTVVPLSIEAQ